jgi:serine/threonine-protein phosphatase 5
MNSNEEEAEKFNTEGNNYYKYLKYDKAIESYTKAIEKNNKKETYYSNRSLMHLSLHQFQYALEDALKAISLNNKFIKAYHRAGTAYIGVNDLKEAKEIIEKGLKIDNNNKELIKVLENINELMKSEIDEVKNLKKVEEKQKEIEDLILLKKMDDLEIKYRSKKNN